MHKLHKTYIFFLPLKTPFKKCYRVLFSMGRAPWAKADTNIQLNGILLLFKEQTKRDKFFRVPLRYSYFQDF